MLPLAPVPILIVENIAPARKFLRKILSAEGYPVLEASNGASALAFLRHVTSPLVALLEWDLPDYSGIDVCRRVRAENLAHRMLIVLTARSGKEDLAALERSGADDCLFKPYTQKELLDRVRMASEIMALEGAMALGVEELREAVERVKGLVPQGQACAHCEGRRERMMGRGGNGTLWQLRDRFGREAG